MILNVRGTSGSGKTELVRRFMAYVPDRWLPHYVPKRKRPLLYRTRPNDYPGVTVLGSYENECGGCDTIKTWDETFALVRQEHARGNHVLFEGLLLTAEIRRTLQLHLDGLPVKVALIDLPVETCLESVNARRRKKNPEAEPVNPKNTESKWKGAQQAMRRFEAAGLPCFRGDRQAVLEFALRELAQ